MATKNHSFSPYPVERGLFVATIILSVFFLHYVIPLEHVVNVY